MKKAMLEIQSVRKKTSTAEEAWLQIGVSRAKFYQMVKQGQIKVIRCGSKILVPDWALEAFLSQGRDAQ